MAELVMPPRSCALRFWRLLLANTAALVGYWYFYALLGPTGLLLINTPQGQTAES